MASQSRKVESVVDTGAHARLLRRRSDRLAALSMQPSGWLATDLRSLEAEADYDGRKLPVCRFYKGPRQCNLAELVARDVGFVSGTVERGPDHTGLHFKRPEEAAEVPASKTAWTWVMARLHGDGRLFELSPEDWLGVAAIAKHTTAFRGVLVIWIKENFDAYVDDLCGLDWNSATAAMLLHLKHAAALALRYQLRTRFKQLTSIWINHGRLPPFSVEDDSALAEGRRTSPLSIKINGKIATELALWKTNVDTAIREIKYSRRESCCNDHRDGCVRALQELKSQAEREGWDDTVAKCRARILDFLEDRSPVIDPHSDWKDYLEALWRVPFDRGLDFEVDGLDVNDVRS